MMPKDGDATEDQQSAGLNLHAASADRITHTTCYMCACRCGIKAVSYTHLRAHET